jgi:pre-mRNA-splicing factor SYF2
MMMDARKVKMELRAKMVRNSGPHTLFTLPQRLSMKANRASFIEESAKAKMTASHTARLERQRKLAEILGTQAEAER